MQVLMDVKELRRIRARWFKAGIFFTLTLGLAIALALSTASQGANADNKITVTSDFKTVKPDIYLYPTPAVVINESTAQTQTGHTPTSINDWGIMWLVAFFTFFIASMIAVIIVYVRSRIRQREIDSKPDGFWEWNNAE